MSKPNPIAKSYLRIGQLAERSGVSAKALRLYEQRGLLKPCTHSHAGYRLYGPDALRALMQIIVLKRSGFTLAGIAALRSSQASVIAALLGERIETLQRHLAEQTRALHTLRAIAQRVDSASVLGIDQLLESITMTDNIDMRFTDTQREEILTRAETFSVLHAPGEHENFCQRVEQRIENLGTGIEAAQRPWRELSAQIRAAMDAGTPVATPAAAELANRWHAQLAALTAVDPDFLTKLRDAYTRHPELMVEQSMSPAMMDYMSAAMAAAGLNPAS